MPKPILLISYANSATQPLPNLKREEVSVLKVLQDRKALRDDFEIESPTTREGIVEVLKDTVNRENLLVVSYSGHAADDRLVTEGEETNSEGITALLSRCPNLALVILNGCSTEGQVAQLFEAFSETGLNTPVIIATSASVGDKVAADFGIAFFEQLFTYGRNIKTAFATAFAIAKTYVEAKSLREDDTEGRFLKKMRNEGTWGIYVAQGKDKKEATEITFNQINTFTNTPYKPNERLFRELIKGLTNYSIAIERKYEQDRKVITDINPYKSKIYDCFPFPISKRLQRLESSGSVVDGKDTIFFNKIDKNRLGELLRTYQTILDILFAILQAELYSYIDKFEPSEDKSQIIKVGAIFTKLDVFYGEISMIEAFESCLNIIKSVEEHLMVKELAQLSEFDKNEFVSLGYYFEKLQNSYPNLSDLEAIGLVEFTEIKLTAFLKRVLFLANYNLTSVENILLNRRRTNNPIYKHQLFKQQWGGAEPTKEPEVLNEFLDDSSVILHKTVDGNPFGQYLNLSPFLIDDILFKEKSTISNILVFSKFKPKIEEYEYRYLIFGNSEYEKKSVIFQDNDDGNTEIAFENRAFAEIKDEWDSYKSKIAQIQENHL